MFCHWLGVALPVEDDAAAAHDLQANTPFQGLPAPPELLDADTPVPPPTLRMQPCSREYNPQGSPCHGSRSSQYFNEKATWRRSLIDVPCGAGSNRMAAKLHIRRNSEVRQDSNSQVRPLFGGISGATQHLKSDRRQVIFHFRAVAGDSDAGCGPEKGVGHKSASDRPSLYQPLALDSCASRCVNRDLNYIVRNDEVILVDPNTGRLMEVSRWTDGYHQVNFCHSPVSCWHPSPLTPLQLSAWMPALPPGSVTPGSRRRGPWQCWHTLRRAAAAAAATCLLARKRRQRPTFLTRAYIHEVTMSCP